MKIILALYNRGYYGTSHGWAIVNSVAWNCDVRSGALIVQQQPTGQNFAIGCKGDVTGQKPPAPFDHTEGYIEGTGKDSLNPRSLYLAQLAERKHATKAERSEGNILPDEFRLYQNFPNPFNPSTTINVILNRSGFTTLKVYDILGREVRNLIHENLTSGRYTVQFDADGLPSGIYFYYLVSGKQSASKNMLLLK